MPSNALEPVRTSPEFWRINEVEAALDARDMGALFRLLRQRTGASQNRIGITVGMPQSEVSLIMSTGRRQRRVSAHTVLERIADGLDIPDHARARLGLAHRFTSDFPDGARGGEPTGLRPLRRDDLDLDLDHAERLSAAANASDTSDMLRRTVLSTLVVLGVNAVGPSATPPLADEDSFGTVDDWEEVAWEYGFTYLSQPRAELLKELAPDLVAVQRRMRAAPDDRAARRLADVGAHLAALVAMACTHLQYTREARHSWRLARRLGSDSGRAETQSWVHGHEVTAAIYLRRPLPVILQLAERASAINESSAFAGGAELLAGRAQVLAALGQRDEAISAVSKAEAAFERLPARVTQNRQSIFGWPEHRIRHTQAYVQARVGDEHAADSAFDRALRAYDSSRVISRSQIEMHRATSLVRRGEVGEGSRHATAVIDKLPPNHLGQLTLAVADDVSSAIPPSANHHPDVRGFRERLADLHQQAQQ